jgi:hypothetical protein
MSLRLLRVTQTQWEQLIAVVIFLLLVPLVHFLARWLTKR